MRGSVSSHSSSTSQGEASISCWQLKSIVAYVVESKNKAANLAAQNVRLFPAATTDMEWLDLCAVRAVYMTLGLLLLTPTFGPSQLNKKAFPIQNSSSKVLFTGGQRREGWLIG